MHKLQKYLEFKNPLQFSDGHFTLKLSPDDTFITDQHQNQLRQAKIDGWAENVDNLREEMGDEIYRNFQRNQTLIDFDYIPEEIQNTIINTFNDSKPAPNM